MPRLRQVLLPAVVVAVLIVPGHLVAHDEDLAGELARWAAACAAQPDAAEPHIRRAQVLIDHGRSDEAAADLAAAARMVPADPAVAGLEAQVASAGGRWIEVVAAADRCLADGLDRPRILRLRADALLRLGRQVEAWAGFQRLCAGSGGAEPDAWIAGLSAGVSAVGAGPALEWLAAGEARLHHPIALDLAALAVERMSAPERSLARLDRLAAGPGGHIWQVDRGEILASLGRTAEAREALGLAAAGLAALPADRRDLPPNQRLQIRIAALTRTVP